MAALVQVELRSKVTETKFTHVVVWIEALLKPTVGMILTCKGDPREWEVVQAYTKTPIDSKEAMNTSWKVGGLK